MDLLSTILPMHLVWPVLLSAGLGAALGLERDLHDRPAGLRTSILITMGSCLFTLLSLYAFPAGADPSRVASQIVTGVGFLGAGVLIKDGTEVHGLTTAANIWIAACIGMTVGVGAYALAAFITALTLGILVVLRPLSRKLDMIGEERNGHSQK